MGFLKKLFGSSTPEPVQVKEVVRPEPTPEAAKPKDPANEFDPHLAGKSDSTLNGWYDLESAQLFPGVNVSSDDVVLDVGCGESGVIDFAVGMGADVIFADIDPEKVALKESQLRLREGQKATPLVTDANPLPLEDGVATKIVSTEVIEHVADPKVFLAELVRVGAPGAIYLLSVPAPESEELQKGTAAPNYFEHPNHIRIVGHEEFRELIESAGLIVERQELTGFYWSVWWMFFWVSNQDLSPPWSPLLTSWAKTWSLLMDNPRAAEIKAALDKTIPKQQIIVARKPG